MIEPDAQAIRAVQARHAQEDAAARHLIATQVDPMGERAAVNTAARANQAATQLASRVQAWAKFSPTLPAGAMLSFAQADIDPHGPLGDYLLAKVVPHLLYPKTYTSGIGTLEGGAGTPEYAAQQLVADPAKLEALKSMPLDSLTNVVAQPVTTVASLSSPQVQALGATGQLPDPSGFVSGVMAVTRETGAVAQAGMETLQVGFRQAGAQTAHEVSNVAHGRAPMEGTDTFGNPYQSQSYTTPEIHIPGVSDIPGINRIPGLTKSDPFVGGRTVGGAPVEFGSAPQLEDPGQITFGQQARGKSLGHGFLPAGPAVEAAQKAQRASASVAGHAMTPGRALAAFVTTPDSLAFKAVSGVADAYVALHVDPALLITGEITRAVKNAKSVGAFTQDAVSAAADHLIDALGPDNATRLREWAQTRAGVMPETRSGAIARAAVAREIESTNLRDLIVSKITDEPTSINELINDGTITSRRLAARIVGQKAGLLSGGLYDAVHPEDFQQFLVSPDGEKFFQTMADHGFTEIGHRTKWSMSAKLQLALAEATTPDEARAALQAHLSELHTLPTVGFHPIHDMRWGSILPTKMADVQDADSLLERAREDLQLFKIPRSEWDNYLPAVVRSEGDYTDAYDAFRKIGNRAAEVINSKIPGYAALDEERTMLRGAVRRMGDQGPVSEADRAVADRLDAVRAQVKVHDDLTKRLTNYFYERGNQSRTWHNDEITGGASLVAGLVPSSDGMTAVEGPFGISELLNRGIPTPGTAGQATLRQIQRAVGTWAPLFNSPVVGALPRLAREMLVDMIADNLTQYAKSFAMMHPGTALRIFGGAGARMLAAGVGDLSENPVGLTALIAGAGDIDMTAEKLISNIGGYQNRMAAQIGRSFDWRAELAGGNNWSARGWSTFNPDSGSREAIDAWANRLSHTSNDPVAREVARFLVTGDSLDAVKQSVWDGPLAETRQQMIDANVTWGHGEVTGYSKDLVNRAQSDAWVDAWAKIVQDETGNHTPLLQKVADGIGPHISDKFRSDLTKLAGDGIAPHTVTGPIKLEGAARRSLPQRVMGSMLTALAGEPTQNYLGIPTWKRLYFADSERLLKYLSPEDASSWRGLASAYGVDLPQVERDVTHTINLKAADTIAKSYAFHEFGKIFYEPSHRSIFVDQIRDLIPFAHAIGEHARAWVRLISQNPKVLRVLQMGITDARQSGWWTKDQYGKMQMNMIPAAALNTMIGANVGLTGEASRLNIATQGWPSVGLVVSLSAPAILSHFGTNDLAQRLLRYTDPYGDPNARGNLIDSLAPGFFDKLVTSGYLAGVPLLNAIGTPDKNQERMLNQVAMQIMRSKMSSGHYDMSDEKQVHQVWEDSVDAAKTMYLIRGAVQFMSPIAPQFDPHVKIKDGSVLQTYLLTNDFRAMLKANEGDEYQTTTQFIDKYGVENIFSAQLFTRPLQYGLPTTAEAEAWKSQNGAFAAQYKDIYGYFAPQEGGFDMNAFTRQIHDGTREALTGPDWYHLAEARIGNAVYDNLRRSLPANLNDAQQAILDAYKAQLTKQWPGFNQDNLKLRTDTKPQTIDAFKGAIQDPAVRDTPMAQAIGQYLDVRDAALARQKALGLSGKQVSTSPDAAQLRGLLYRWGNQLASQHPEFANVWQHVFSYEVQNQQTQNVAA